VAKPMMVVIGENTYQGAKSFFECRSLGAMALKGKEKTVEAYEVVRALDAADLTPPGAATGA
jgi:class 3 adenylate cyclase